VATAPRRELAKGLLIWDFSVTGKNKSQGRAPGEVAPTQAASWRGQGAGRATRAPGGLVTPLWPIFWSWVPPGTWIFSIFYGNFLGHLKIHIPAHKKTIQVALLKTASVRVSFIQIMQE